MGLWVIFLTGMVTSLHCVAMCGNFVLTFAITGEQKARSRLSAMLPHLYYNGTKLLSYTLVGIGAGFLGSAVDLGGFKGTVNIVAGVLMILMALNMLNVHPALRVFSFRMPRKLSARLFKSAAQADTFAPAVFGLFNGLMPCGPLQAMLILAASTGSPAQGGLTMLAFGLGTVPLMLVYGTFASTLAKRFKGQVTLAGAVIIIILGLVVMNRGLVLTGFKYNFKYVSDKAIAMVIPPETTEAGQSADGKVQNLKIDIQGGYVPSSLTVKPNVPVRLTINRPGNDFCSERFVFPKFGIDKQLKPNGTTVIEFTPTETGQFTFTCGMGMYQGSLNVAGAGAADRTVNYGFNRFVVGATLISLLLTLGLKPPDPERIKDIIKTGSLRRVTA
ncbi:MAG: sulfite exporter TauE/SafE family protein [Actinomycetota bacterium]